ARGSQAQAPVRRGAVKPGAECVTPRQPVEMTPRSKERVLKSVLGVLQRPQHSVAVEAQLARGCVGKPTVGCRRWLISTKDPFLCPTSLKRAGAAGLKPSIARRWPPAVTLPF